MASKISLLFVTILAIVLVCESGVPKKREVKEGELTSDASQAFDKFFEDVNQKIQQIAKDGINLDGVLSNITAKTNELGGQIQQITKELGAKVQEAAKQQGLTE